MPRCGCPDVELNADGTPKPFRLGKNFRKKNIQSTLSNVTSQGNIEIWSNKTGGH